MIRLVSVSLILAAVLSACGLDVSVGSVTATPQPTQTPSVGSSCEALLPHIIKLSEEKDDPSGLELLRVYNVEQISKSPSKLECEGEARWNKGENSMIRFHWGRDEDGDAFYAYEPAEN